MSPQAGRIAELNDQLRTTFLGGKVLFTEGIASLDDEARSEVVEKVQTFSEFTEDNDPHGEHDFGAFEVQGAGRVFWKIDYYNLAMDGGSEDASDPRKTRRVLTIMLASEY